MKHEEEHREKNGWLMTVDFVTAATNTLVKKEKFLMYPKKSTAVDALSMIVGPVVLEVIAINNDASCPITLRQSERLLEVAITKDLLDEPVYYKIDGWRYVKLSS